MSRNLFGRFVQTGYGLDGDAAAAAACVAELGGRSADVVAARAAAVVVAAAENLSCSAIAAQAHIGYRTALRLRAAHAEPRIVEAVANQLRLRADRTTR